MKSSLPNQRKVKTIQVDVLQLSKDFSTLGEFYFRECVRVFDISLSVT